jgi:hypothetical protein
MSNNECMAQMQHARAPRPRQRKGPGEIFLSEFLGIQDSKAMRRPF